MKLRVVAATSVAMMWLSLACAGPIIAQRNDNGNGNAGGLGAGQNGPGNAFGHDHDTLPSAADTPDLSSLLLFGSGALGTAGYALMRMRARRRQDRRRRWMDSVLGGRSLWT